MFNYVMSHVVLFQKQSSRAEVLCKYQENFRFSFIETILLHGCSPVNSLHICRASFSKFQSSSGDMCALREPLGNIMRELFYYYYLLWSFFAFCSKSIFPKNWIFFCVLVEENQEAFSEKCSLKLGSHGGDKLHRPPSWPEINVVGTIKDLSASFHRRRWIGPWISKSFDIQRPGSSPNHVMPEKM